MFAPAPTPVAALSAGSRDTARDWCLQILTRLLYEDAQSLANRARAELCVAPRELTTDLTGELALFVANMYSRRKSYAAMASLSAAVNQALRDGVVDEPESRRVLGALVDAQWATTPVAIAPGDGRARHAGVDDAHAYVHAAALVLAGAPNAGAEVGWYITARLACE